MNRSPQGDLAMESNRLADTKIVLCLLILFLALLYSKIVFGMVSDWYHDENYSHGFLVPFIAGYLLYQRRAALREAMIRPDSLGLFVFVAGVLQLLLGWLSTEYFTMRSSLITVLCGVTLYWYGRDVFRVLRAPLLYLLLMVPIPYIIYDSVAFPLKLFVTKVSVWALKLMGVVVWREGNILMFPNITLEVADACSGLRSIMSLLALSVAFALLFHKSLRNRLIIVGLTIPLAIVCNMLRVIGTGFLAQFFGAAAAEGFFHEFAGLLVFLTAVLVLFGVGVFLRRHES